MAHFCEAMHAFNQKPEQASRDPGQFPTLKIRFWNLIDRGRHIQCVIFTSGFAAEPARKTDKTLARNRAMS
jgi:hypothetical protein